MVPELEKPRVTEIQVRMNCNGCVQKIKKALHGINGIYDVYIDFPLQKLTVVRWTDPEKILKAVKKTRKTDTISPTRKPRTRRRRKTHLQLSPLPPTPSPHSRQNHPKSHRPPPPTYARFSRADQYVDEYQYQYDREGKGGDGNRITSIFDDENPNACRIV